MQRVFQFQDGRIGEDHVMFIFMPMLMLSERGDGFGTIDIEI